MLWSLEGKDGGSKYVVGLIKKYMQWSVDQAVKCNMANFIYLPNIETREFIYFDTGKVIDLFKISVWVCYANLFLPALFQGLYKAIKYRDSALLYEPIYVMVFLKTGWE